MHVSEFPLRLRLTLEGGGKLISWAAILEGRGHQVAQIKRRRLIVRAGSLEIGAWWKSATTTARWRTRRILQKKLLNTYSAWFSLRTVGAAVVGEAVVG